MRFPPNVDIVQESVSDCRVMVVVDGKIVLNGQGEIDYIKPEHIMRISDSKTLVERIMWAVSEKPKESIQWVH